MMTALSTSSSGLRLRDESRTSRRRLRHEARPAAPADYLLRASNEAATASLLENLATDSGVDARAAALARRRWRRVLHKQWRRHHDGPAHAARPPGAAGRDLAGGPRYPTRTGGPTYARCTRSPGSSWLALS